MICQISNKKVKKSYLDYYKKGRVTALLIFIYFEKKKSLLEAVINLITKYKVDIDTAVTDVKLDPKYKSQVLEKLNPLALFFIKILF